MRLYLLAFLVFASGCMEGAFPWARRQPPPFAKDVIKQGMEESSVVEDKSSKPPDDAAPKVQTAAKAPEVSPLSWILEDTSNRAAAGQPVPDQLRAPPSLMSR